MNIEQEIRAQIEKNKGLKLAVGEINNHLSILEGLLRNERDDAQKQVDEAYQRGLHEGNDIGYKDGIKDGQNEAWECARKLFSSMADSDIEKAFPTEWNNGGFNALINLQPQEAIERLKAYEEKQKADDKIEVGDEVNWLGDCFIVTRIFQPRNMKEQCDGIDDDGCVYSNVLIDDLEKTGRHFDIQSILEEMRHD